MLPDVRAIPHFAPGIGMGHSRQSVSYEIIRYSPYWDAEGWKEVQLALDGQRCEPFCVHRSAVDYINKGQSGGEDSEAWWAYLTRSARSVTEQTRPI